MLEKNYSWDTLTGPFSTELICHKQSTDNRPLAVCWNAAQPGGQNNGF